MTQGNDTARRAADLLHHRAAGLAKGEALSPPIHPAVTFHLPEVEGAAHIYGRNGQPGWDAVEAQLALLEDAPCVAFPSGMAAISAALIATLRAGARVVLPSDGYYVTRVLAREFLACFGVEVTELPTLDYAGADFTGAAVVYLESPSNPGLDLSDIRAVAARAKAAGAVVIADNTTMTPLLQRPLDMGCDMVVAADTKAPAGHSDVLFGHVASRDAAILGRVRDWRRLSGAVPGPFEAWQVARGLETLEVRLARMCASAQVIAERLAAHPRVRGLRYPGLPTDPGHALARAQMEGFGFLIGFALEDADRAEAFLAACPHLARTTSFGGTHSSGERRARWGDPVAPGYIRLSVGLEPVEVLWSGFAAALG
ncbi:MAG: cystathionine gamma-lyase [Gemmobacter sp.]